MRVFRTVVLVAALAGCSGSSISGPPGNPLARVAGVYAARYAGQLTIPIVPCDASDSGVTRRGRALLADTVVLGIDGTFSEKNVHCRYTSPVRDTSIDRGTYSYSSVGGNLVVLSNTFTSVPPNGILEFAGGGGLYTDGNGTITSEVSIEWQRLP